MQTQLGYVSVYDNANKVGYSYSIGSELEFFVKNKLSFSSGLFYSNFYIKHNHQVQALDFSNSFKYYYKLRKRYTFNLHASVILDAKKDGRRVRDGEFQTACSNACSDGAIVFGDINDKESKISESNKNDRAYRLLESIGTKPNVLYQVKIRNSKKV